MATLIAYSELCMSLNYDVGIYVLLFHDFFWLIRFIVVCYENKILVMLFMLVLEHENTIE